MSCDCELGGNFELIKRLKGSFILTSPLQGILNLDNDGDLNTSILNGNFNTIINLNGNLVLRKSLSGIYCCVPSNAVEFECFTKLDFSLSCNSAHIISAGF